MTNQNNAAQAANENPLSDEYVNAIIQRHGYDSPETVIARLAQWIGLNGGENGVTLLMYEAHKALCKLRAPVVDEPPGGTRWPVLRAMARNYTAGKHTWDALDANACEQAAEEIRHLLAALASAPVAEPRLEWSAKALYDAIKDVLLNHRLSNWADGDGEFFPLVDHLCSKDAKTTESGEYEIALICDAIYNDVLTKSAPVAGEALGYVAEAALKTNFDDPDARIDLFKTDLGLLGHYHTATPVAVYAAPQASEAVLDAVLFVLKTFKAAEAQGYHTRDRQFAISILEQALSSPQASAEARWIGIDLGENGIADVRNAALEQAYEAVACLYAAHYQHGDLSALAALKEAGDDIRALKQPQAPQGQQ